jgi:hypothetical protein
MISNRTTISGYRRGIPAASYHCGRRTPRVVAHRALPVPVAAPVTELADPEGMWWVTLPAGGRTWSGELG